MKKINQSETIVPNPKQSDIEAQNQKIFTSKRSWYVILFIYTILLTFTGGVTFFYNNGFSSREENIKNLELMRTTAQLSVYKKFLKIETENMKSINKTANQSFNVALGSLLGFLSATLANLKYQETEDIEDSKSDVKSDVQSDIKITQ